MSKTVSTRRYYLGRVEQFCWASRDNCILQFNLLLSLGIPRAQRSQTASPPHSVAQSTPTPPTKSSPAKPYPAWSTSNMLIHDDELFGDDEFTRDRSFPPVTLSESGGLTKRITYAESGGGKIYVRVNLDLTLSLVDLSVNVGCLLSMYEGTSEGGVG